MRTLITRGLGIGVVAGLAGVAAMTGSELLEQLVTHRPSSQIPGRTLARLLGRDPAPDTAAIRTWNWTMHIGTAVSVGMLRGVMAASGLTGPMASAMFTVVRLNTDQTVENLTGVGAPPWTWPGRELLIDVTHKAVYAFATGAVADFLASRLVQQPGQVHAAAEPGRRSDVGPVATP